LRIYFSLGEIVIQLAHYIRSHGYTCTVEHPIGDSDVLHVPLALKAGFGEVELKDPPRPMDPEMPKHWYPQLNR
jgi:hypothetical protein